MPEVNTLQFSIHVFGKDCFISDILCTCYKLKHRHQSNLFLT